MLISVLNNLVDKSPVRCINKDAEKAMRKINDAKIRGFGQFIVPRKIASWNSISLPV